MSETKKTNSFTEGSIFKGLVRFAIPVLGALILQAAYGAVDLMVVGYFGDSSSISAVGTGSAFMQMITFVITSLAMGSTVVIGQHIGEKRKDKAGKAVSASVILFGVIGIVMTLILELAAPLAANMMNVPKEAFTKTVSYIRICSAGILIIIAYNVISAVLRGTGNAKLPLLFVGIACAVNVLGDLFFVGALSMDVAGAALATVLAQLVSVIASVIVLKRKNLEIEMPEKKLSMDKEELKLILRIGVPIAVQETMVQISFLIINSIVNSMGLDPSAGYGVAQKVIAFILLVPSSLMQSVSAFTAQNIGAGKRERAKKGMFVAASSGMALGILFFLAGFFEGHILASAFSKDAEVIHQAALYLKGFSFECILTCILFSFIGFFNGNGISFPVMLQGISSAFCIRIPVSLFMAHLADTSLFLVGLASPITTIYGVIFFAVCFFIYRKKI